jgi:hypothetical protein
MVRESKRILFLEKVVETSSTYGKSRLSCYIDVTEAYKYWCREDYVLNGKHCKITRYVRDVD